MTDDLKDEARRSKTRAASAAWRAKNPEKAKAASAARYADYDILVMRGGLKRADALVAIGRADLVGVGKND
jgi:hypothetical protein